ncbi:hypothetical protein [Pseudomonas benzenivorans]|uniref:SUR7/PalI family protein n=1 Tax=Pseudomonas benzenivorans TaxID=556533 RepID=A0ABY5HEG3_9PSED|nr:hypothetical protein [Pseudomonas benzenivorans]UTW09650.1 hypothetical protein KDW96_10235 [Pseudomonas benzenivorans]
MSKYFEKIVKFFAYMLCERNELLPGGSNLKDIKVALAKTKFSKYSWLERGNEVRIEKRSIFFPASHYLTLKVENGGLRCKTKVNTIERLFLISFLVLLLSAVASTPFIALIFVNESPGKYNILIAVPALLAVSIALMAWLKLICLTLAYFSGVSKLAEWVRCYNASGEMAPE